VAKNRSILVEENMKIVVISEYTVTFCVIKTTYVSGVSTTKARQSYGLEHLRNYT